MVRSIAIYTRLPSSLGLARAIVSSARVGPRTTNRITLARSLSSYFPVHRVTSENPIHVGRSINLPARNNVLASRDVRGITVHPVSSYFPAGKTYLPKLREPRDSCSTALTLCCRETRSEIGGKKENEISNGESRAADGRRDDYQSCNGNSMSWRG